MACACGWSFFVIIARLALVVQVVVAGFVCVAEVAGVTGSGVRGEGVIIREVCVGGRFGGCHNASGGEAS